MFVAASAEGVAAITAGASLLAACGLAGVTIYTTRQRLIGERERLTATLTHDRELSDIADLRQLLDEAASAAHHVNGVLVHVWGTFELPSHAFNDLPKLDQENEEKLYEAVKPLALLTPRIVLRLGIDDAITKTYIDIEEAAGMMQNAAFQRRTRPFDAEKSTEEAEAAHTQMLSATGAFFVAAAERAGTLSLLRE